MATCKKCGSEILNNAKFCNECGEKVEFLSAENENNVSQNDVYVPDVTMQEMFLKTSGRLNRKRYFKRMMALGLFQTIITVILSSLSLVMYGYFPDSVIIFMGIIVILLMVPSYCLMVRRLHDIGKDNKLAIAVIAIGIVVNLLFDPENAINENYLVALILSLVIFGICFYILLKDGTHGENKYGSDPLNR